jgi:hypothetical protein
MRTHKLNKSRKLYRSDNTTTRHYSINPGSIAGGETVKKPNELLAKRETMHGRQKRGRDYTPLFYFLVKQIGQPWMGIQRSMVVLMLQRACFLVGRAE